MFPKSTFVLIDLPGQPAMTFHEELRAPGIRGGGWIESTPRGWRRIAAPSRGSARPGATAAATKSEARAALSAARLADVAIEGDRLQQENAQLREQIRLRSTLGSRGVARYAAGIRFAVPKSVTLPSMTKGST